MGSAFVAYLLSRRLLSAKVPAVLPALAVGLICAALTSRFGEPPGGWSGPALALTMPTFSLSAILTAAPIFVAMVALVGNVPGSIYLHSQGYDPPIRTLDIASGLAAVVSSFLGPTPSACCRS